MKNFFFWVLLLFTGLLCIYSCTKTDAKHTAATRQNIFKDISVNGLDARGRFVGTASFVSISEANRMINSYIGSTRSLTDESPVHGWTVNGAALTMVLSNPSVKSVKFMLGHKMDYILSGQEGLVPSATSKAVTLIAVGLDSAGNYTTENDEVLDNSMPCPEICPPGSGGNSTITNP